MKKAFLILFLLLFSGISTRAAGIRGKVNSADDGKPLPGANIAITGTPRGAVADKDGNFGIYDLDEGVYIVKVSYMGYNSVNQNVVLETAETARVTFSLYESVLNMDVVVVTATRTEKALKNVPALTEIIRRRQLESTGAVIAWDALNELPTLDFAPDSHGSNITMHGLGPKYVLFLIDGERIAGEVRGNINFSRLNASDIERIEIVKGASSCLYGTNAIAGVVNIITRQVNSPFQVDAYSRFSEYDELGTGGSVGIRYKGITSKTSVMHKKSDGYDLFPETIDRTVEKYSDLNINQKITLNPFKNLTVHAGGGYYVQEIFKAERRVRYKYPKNYDINYNLKAQYRFSKRLQLESSWYSDTYDTKDVLELLDDEERRTYQHRSQVGRILMHYTVLDNQILTTGAEFQDEKVFSNRITGETHTAQGQVFFIQHDMKWRQQWNIVAGFRLNNHSEYGSHFTPSLSAMYQALPFNLRATYARGFKSPTLKELYMNWDHGGGGPFVYGNPGLKPETSDYMSVSVEYINNRCNGSVSFFHTALKDMIDSRPEPGDPNINYYGNVDEAMTRGLEALFKFDMGSGLLFSSGYSLVDTEDKSTGSPLYGRARHSGTVQLEFYHNRSGFAANFRGKFIGTKLWDEVRDEETDKIIRYEQSPHAVWRFTATKKILSYFKLTVGVNNIFDYTDKDYLITPGRIIYTGMSFSYNQ